MGKDKFSNNDSKESKNDLWRTLLITGGVVFAFWLLSWILIDLCISECDNRGTFGDKFGAVNALFSGLAFAGLIVTLLYQKEELKLQREELKETRNELNAQKLEFQEQNKTMKRQRFENTFFNMLSLQQEIVANLSYEKVEYAGNPINPFNNNAKHTLYNGRTLFREMYLNLTVTIPGNLSYKGIRHAIQIHNCDIYSSISDTTRFDHYFRHLYRIYKFVDTSDLIEDSERYNYACIIRSQLSDYELVMLFYNCLTENGRKKFKPLIEKYTIFNNLRVELLANKEHKKEYVETAYSRI